jgi:hypothetical protein
MLPGKVSYRKLAFFVPILISEAPLIRKGLVTPLGRNQAYGIKTVHRVTRQEQRERLRSVVFVSHTYG